MLKHTFLTLILSRLFKVWLIWKVKSLTSKKFVKIFERFPSFQYLLWNIFANHLPKNIYLWAIFLNSRFCIAIWYQNLKIVSFKKRECRVNHFQLLWSTVSNKRGLHVYLFSKKICLKSTIFVNIMVQICEISCTFSGMN